MVLQHPLDNAAAIHMLGHFHRRHLQLGNHERLSSGALNHALDHVVAIPVEGHHHHLPLKPVQNGALVALGEPVESMLNHSAPLVMERQVQGFRGKSVDHSLKNRVAAVLQNLYNVVLVLGALRHLRKIAQHNSILLNNGAARRRHRGCCGRASSSLLCLTSQPPLLAAGIPFIDFGVSHVTPGLVFVGWKRNAPCLNNRLRIILDYIRLLPDIRNHHQGDRDHDTVNELHSRHSKFRIHEWIDRLRKSHVLVGSLIERWHGYSERNNHGGRGTRHKVRSKSAVHAIAGPQTLLIALWHGTARMIRLHSGTVIQAAGDKC
mmetsp:Transcript_37205/g.81312  ORF Transcript_37205/g.81312 Transcript_37205/m.81312 type:complete len:320 (-) Transcript_37205:14-973(-)